MACRHDEIIEGLLGANPRHHHALVDACALTQAVMQTEDEFRRGIY